MSTRPEPSRASIERDAAAGASAERSWLCGCGETIRSTGPGLVVCTRCRLVHRETPAGRIIDVAATRAALLEAAAACAGPDWGLAALVWDRHPDAQSVANYRRLGQAETGVASLRGRGR